jgi:hypothetical protein
MVDDEIYSPYMLCEKCEFYTYRENYDEKTNLCSLCLEVNNDNDPTPHKEASESTQTADGLHK